jgi:hypothetical protein
MRNAMPVAAMRYLCVAATLLASPEIHASQLRCLMRGKDMRPHIFVEVFTVDRRLNTITHVANEEATSAGWVQQSRGTSLRLTKLGPGQEHDGEDGLPYWEWTFDKKMRSAKHSVWLAVHGSRSHWRGKCRLRLK